MLTTVEGIYRDGKVELSDVPKGVHTARVLVVFVETEPAPLETGQMLQYGKYATGRESTEEDFKAAEFHGDEDDGLDWR